MLNIRIYLNNSCLFIIAERMKYLAYKEVLATSYFWRTYTGAELDYVEELNDELFAYKIKYKKAKMNAPKGLDKTPAAITDNSLNNIPS